MKSNSSLKPLKNIIGDKTDEDTMRRPKIRKAENDVEYATLGQVYEEFSM